MSDQPAGDRAPRLVGVVATLAGLGILVAAIFASDEGMNAPRWVIGLIGVASCSRASSP